MKIGIIGPPGSGKTTICFGLYYYLRCMGHKVEFVPELVKYKVYNGEDFNVDGFDIANNLEQRKFEEQFAKASLDFLICEAPSCNSYFYASFYEKEDEANILKKIAKKTINNYDVILKLHFSSTKDTYEQFGRKENYEQSKSLNDHIFSEFGKLGFKNTIIDIHSRGELFPILDKILQAKHEKQKNEMDKKE